MKVFLRLSFVGVRKLIFRSLPSLRYLNSVGVNLNWARTNLGEKEKQLSSQYDSDHLTALPLVAHHHPLRLISNYFGGEKSLRTRILTLMPKLTVATMEMFSSLENSWMLCELKSVGAL